MTCVLFFPLFWCLSYPRPPHHTHTHSCTHSYMLHSYMRGHTSIHACTHAHACTYTQHTDGGEKICYALNKNARAATYACIHCVCVCVCVCVCACVRVGVCVCVCCVCVCECVCGQGGTINKAELGKLSIFKVHP